MIVDLDRHMELLGYLHTGEAAKRLHMSESSVRTRFERLQKKEGIQNNPDVVAIFCGKHPRWYVSTSWVNYMLTVKTLQSASKNAKEGHKNERNKR